MNIKDIAATLAILGSGTLVMTGCGKDQAPATEVPGGATAPGGAEASCAAAEHPADGHCGGADGGAEAAADGGGEAAPEGEGSCSAAEGEGSCSAAEGEAEGG